MVLAWLQRCDLGAARTIDIAQDLQRELFQLAPSNGFVHRCLHVHVIDNAGPYFVVVNVFIHQSAHNNTIAD